MTTSVGNNSVFRSFFEKQKLTGPNFIDWHRKLRLVLSTEDKEKYLEHHILAAPVALPGLQVPPEALVAHAAWVKGQKEVIELLQSVREFHTCKQEEGQSVSSHVLNMKGYIDNLERLDQPVGQNLAMSLILVSLNKDFDSFVQNYNMHSMGKTVNELHDMLKLHKETLPKKDANPALYAIRAGRGLRGSKKLKPCALSLYVGDGHRAAVEAIETYHLELPSGLVIVFQKEVENQLVKTIMSLRSERGGEYTSQEFLDHLKEHGIMAYHTPPYAPQNNEVSERRNRTLLDMVRSIMSQSTPPKSFWDYALETAARILNMVPTKKIDKTPYEIWHGQVSKLPFENKVFVARNAEFFESKLVDLKASGSVEDLELIQKEDTNPSVDTSLNHEEDDQEIDEPQKLGDLGEPANYKATLLDPESKKCKWLFKKKTNMDGVVYIFKARLVAKGFTQTYEVDYEETFSPVAGIRAIRILIAIAAYYNYEIWQMDVKTAFLDGHLSEEVYMEQPEDVKSYLGRSFAMKDLGDVAYILGIKIYRDRLKRLIDLCQSAYIEKILKRYYMKNSKRGTIPMQKNLKLSKSQGASTPAEKHRMQNIPYASAIGYIMYAVRCTRPDVAFAQNMTSRFQQNSGEEHWIAVKNILKHLRNTKYMFLVYGGNMERELRVSCYTDAEYLTDVDNLKS
nr:hypothetical protein [Tanacetum cinerariifolium]